MPKQPSPLDPDHIPAPPPVGPGRPRPRSSAGKRPPRLRITVIGLGPFQEACLAGMLALALSWTTAELLFRLTEQPVAAAAAGPGMIVSAAMQP